MKLSDYKSTWDDLEITEFNLQDLTGLTREQWLCLTGFFGNPKIKEHPFNESSMQIGGIYPELAIGCKDPVLLISFDIKNRTIENIEILLEKTDQGKKLGLHAHMFQIEKARAVGFKSISLVAAGSGQEKDDIFGGYNVWGKLGYTMQSDSQSEFLEKMKREGKEFECLHEIVLDEEHKSYWKENGISWDGEFDLNPQSHNHRLLKLYLFTKDKRNSGVRLNRVRSWMKNKLGRQ
ncbi:MAG: hypothetical protein SFU20_12805 [Chitinophagaceae bacterium]|nr:hypothetical protein [Chitinophagaceae bacterium]